MPTSFEKPDCGRAIAGVDLDNTIIRYDGLLWKIASGMGLLPAGCAADKESIRDAVRLEHGEEAWRMLQVKIYGERIMEAEFFENAPQVLEGWKKAGIPFVIISHKNQPSYAPMDMRAAALEFLNKHGITRIAEVHFTSSRTEKAVAIAECGCGIFIDDLPEVLLHPKFPAGTRRVLFSPWRKSANLPPNVEICSSWRELDKLVRS